VQLVSPDDDLELLVSLAAQLETATGWLDRRPPGWDG
jgi:amidase